MEPLPARTRFASLRLRLLGLVALVLVPWLALVMYTQADERKVAIAHVNDDAMRLIRIATSNQAAHIEAARELLTAFARLPQLRTNSRSACQALLADMLAAYPLYLNFGLVELDGNMSCSARPARAPVNLTDRSYFKQAVESRRFVIGDYQIGRVTQLPQINYGYPMVDPAGKVEAVVFAAQSLNWLTLALSNVQFPEGAVLVVTDRNGTVLARLPDPEDSIGKVLPEPSVLAILSKQTDGGVFEATDAQGVNRLWAHAPLNRRLRSPGDHRCAQGGRARRYRSTTPSQPCRLRPGDAHRLGRRLVRQQLLHPAPSRRARRRDREARVGRSGSACPAGRRPQRARAAGECVQQHGRDAGNA